jgi:hypothetical protein
LYYKFGDFRCRCLAIWSEREVFEEKFMHELKAVLDPNNPQHKEDEQEIVENFQVNLIKCREWGENQS